MIQMIPWAPGDPPLTFTFTIDDGQTVLTGEIRQSTDRGLPVWTYKLSDGTAIILRAVANGGASILHDDGGITLIDSGWVQIDSGDRIIDMSRADFGIRPIPIIMRKK